MKILVETLLLAILVGMLAAIHQYMGPRVFYFALGLSTIWFVITLVLSTRPPGIPEFISDKSNYDEQQITRRDIVPTLTWSQRIRISLGVACSSCLLLWLSLTLLAR